jgi:glycosyltransferase involved in cell wall biosynthesis
MKILFIPYYPENPYQSILMTSLKQSGVEVYVGNIYGHFSLIKSIRSQVRSDIIHLHWTHPFILSSTKMKTIIKSTSFLLELLILRIFGIKIVWTVHNLISHESGFPAIELFANRFTCLFCNQIIVHGSSIRNEVIRKYRIIRIPPINVIPLANYINYYENKVDQIEARRQLRLSLDDRVFLYFGLVRQYKGVVELINSFNELTEKSRIDGIKLLIVGRPFNNEVKEEVISRCKGNEKILTVLKYVDDKDVQIYMNAADVVVLPFKNILTTSSVSLAMSFGKPIITPAIGNIPDDLNREGGFLYEASERDGLLNAMKQALQTEQGELKAMGRHNFEKVKTYTPENTGKETYEVYAKCLKR